MSGQNWLIDFKMNGRNTSKYAIIVAVRWKKRTRMGFVHITEINNKVR